MTSTMNTVKENRGSSWNSCILLMANVLLRTLKSLKMDIIGSDPYRDRSVDSEDEGEFTGNESMPTELKHHDSVSRRKALVSQKACTH